MLLGFRDSAGDVGEIGRDGSLTYDGDLPIRYFLDRERGNVSTRSADSPAVEFDLDDLMPKLHAAFDLTETWLEDETRWGD